jgi:hypothetical protein
MASSTKVSPKQDDNSTSNKNLMNSILKNRSTTQSLTLVNQKPNTVGKTKLSIGSSNT